MGVRDMRRRIPGGSGEAAEGTMAWGVGRGTVREGLYHVFTTPRGFRGSRGQAETLGKMGGRGGGSSLTCWTETFAADMLETTWTS